MATTQVSPDIPRPSFAKVAASVTRDKSSTAAKIDTKLPIKAVIADGSSHYDGERSAAMRPNIVSIGIIGSSLKELSLRPKDPNSVADGNALLSARQSLSERQSLTSSGKDSGSDESQKCDSSSELEAKALSLDGKSITSGTTFALDEKESLRPDDSASVDAAAREDALFCLNSYFRRDSRLGSGFLPDYRALTSEPADTRLVDLVLDDSPQKILTPASASSERGPPPCAAAPFSAGGSSDALHVIYRQAPDEKLVDALGNPRDRVFLLRLEKDVIDFVQDSKEPYMDLPPSNSFCRMLTHKLADYYQMTHSFEPNMRSVRIFRTPFCRVPASLASMAPQQVIPSVSSTPPPAVLPRKIMRRGQEGDGATSASASKPTSESGSDAKDGTKQAANQKLPLEQREELYKQARERIFGNSEDSVTDNTGDNGMSRTSSLSTNAKQGNMKRGKSGKQRRDDSDSFDSRNQYTPFWGPQQQTWVPQSQGQFHPSFPNHFSGHHPQPAYPPHPQVAFAQQSGGYGNLPVGGSIPAQPMYGPPQVDAFPHGHSRGLVHDSGPISIRQNPPQPPQQQPPPQIQPQQYPPTSSPLAGYGIHGQANAAPQSWAQPGYEQAPFHPRASAPASGPSSAPMGIPYAFGQLPAHVNPHDPKSQHPIPGSYNRNHNLNPQTQSFVPSGAALPSAPPSSFASTPGLHHVGPAVGNQHSAYSGYPPPHGYGGGFLMSRQGSNNSMVGYHTVAPVPPSHIRHPSQMPPMPPMPPMSHDVPFQPPQQHQLPQIPPRNVPGRPAAPILQGQGQIFTHLPNHGDPATLPQKPVTGF